MSKKTIAILAVLLVIAGTAFYFLGPSMGKLTEAQEESLSTGFNMEREGFKEGTSQSAVHIFGVTGSSDVKKIYGYQTSGYYIKCHDRAYEVAGSSGHFVIDAKVDGDQVRIVKQYGGEETAGILKEMPLKYRIKARRFKPYDEYGVGKLRIVVNDKVNKVLGCTVDTDNFLFIDEEEGSYRIGNIDADGNTETKFRGKLSEIMNLTD